MDRRDFLASSLGAAGLSAALTTSYAMPANAEAGPLERTFADAKPLNLKITDLKTFLVDAGNDENYVFVKLYTNQGITGLGEGTLSNKVRSSLLPSRHISAISSEKTLLKSSDIGAVCSSARAIGAVLF